MKLSLTKLTSAGVAHHALVAVLVISAFASFGAYRVFESSAASAAKLNAQGLKTNGCKPGQIKNSAQKCVAYQQVSKIKPECDKYNLQYDSAAKACKTGCKTTYFKKAGNCVKFNEDSKIQDCNAKHQIYDKTKKVCTDTCKSDYQRRSGVCLPKATPAPANQSSQLTRSSSNLPGNPPVRNDPSAAASVKDSCKTQHRPYDEKLNRCKNSCEKGWYKKNDRLPCIRNKQAKPSEAASTTSVAPCQTLASQQTARCASIKAPSTTGQPVLNDPADETVGEFRIKVYRDSNFKGESKTFTSAQSTMPAGWNDQISSFKIQKGRWQICEDKNFKTKCVKRWASDADLAKGGKDSQNNKISSLRPVTTTTFVDAPEDIIPACRNAAGQPVAPTADNTCPPSSTLTCPTDYELRNGACKKRVVDADVAVPVDKSFKGDDGKRLCELLGREWISKVNGKTVNAGEYGCSLQTCKLRADGAPRGEGTQKYCVSNAFDAAYAAKLEENQCKKLHRIWVNQADLCAQLPNRKDADQTVVNAKQCQKTHSTYYVFKGKDKEDECFKPSFFQEARGVVKATGGALRSALIQGPRAYCNIVKKESYHWDGEECVKDRTGKEELMIAVGIKEADFPHVNFIISRESGWNARAVNPSSGATGLCQALPGSKMASAGADWATNPLTQMKWCNNYAIERYGSWFAAHTFWVINHWW